MDAKLQKERKEKEEKDELQKKLHTMLLHETMTIHKVEVDGKFGFTTVMRVPGGWLYNFCHDVEVESDSGMLESDEKGKVSKVRTTEIARQAVMTTTFVPFNVEFNA